MIPPVYITGLGVVSPAGCGADAGFRALTGGRRCTRWIDDPRLTGGGAVSAGVVVEFEPPAGTDNRDRVCQLAVAAADEAFAAAGLTDRGVAPDRLAVSFGTSKGGILSFVPACERLGILSERTINICAEVATSVKKYLFTDHFTSVSNNSRSNKRYPHEEGLASLDLLRLLSDIPPDAPARTLAARFGARAGAHATVAACATGVLAIIRGVQAIAGGEADAVLAGSSDASLHPLWFAAFRRMGVLAEPANPEEASRSCRPFDAARSGFVIGEGAAAMVLESADSARNRGVRAVGRILGYCAGSDPAGLARVQPDGAPLARVAEIACDRAGIDPADLAAIHAHGTGTSANDLVEIAALRSLLGRRAAEIPVVSIKGAIGHLLGAAGSVEAAIAVLSAANRVCPPNATLGTPDRGFHGICLPQQSRETRPGPILKLSMGFGGHLAALVIEAD